MHHQNDKLAIAAKKAKSSLEKAVTMIAEDRYCIDIIQQNLAVIGLLHSINSQLLESHLHHCVKDAAKANDEPKLNAMMEELLKVLQTARSK